VYIYIYIYIYISNLLLGVYLVMFFGTDQEALRWRPKASSWLHPSVSPSQRKRLAWNGCRNNLHQLLGPWKLGDGLCLKTQQPIPKLGWSLGLGIPVQMFFFVVDRSKMQLLVNHVVCQTGPNRFLPSKQCCLDGSWAILKNEDSNTLFSSTKISKTWGRDQELLCIVFAYLSNDRGKLAVGIWAPACGTRTRCIRGSKEPRCAFPFRKPLGSFAKSPEGLERGIPLDSCN
jgi:hypothetical protein